MYIKILLLLFIILYNCNFIKEDLVIENYYSQINKKKHFDKLMKYFHVIFPDSNRNAGGAQFYYFIDSQKEKLTKDLFLLYNQFYCGVSGSPIDPTRKYVYNYVLVKHIDGSDYIGKYYRCCTPCLADIMKYTKIEEHTIELKDGPYKHMVITINDPCKYEKKIPKSISSYKCSNNNTENGIKSNSDRLIVAVLHDYKKYNSNLHDHIINPILDLSEDRMNTDFDKLKYGMGDIFARLSSLHKLNYSI
jgi:hypothetical protein